MIRAGGWKETVHILFVSDPRFYEQLWPNVSELRKQGCKLHYWHVWDNGPAPFFNRYIPRAVDTLLSISKSTHHGMQKVIATTQGELGELRLAEHAFSPSGPYLPLELGKPQIDQLRRRWFKTTFPGRFVFLWDNKNFWRKVPGHMLYAFALARKEQPNIALVMKTNAAPFYNQGAGQDLIECASRFGLELGKDLVFVDDHELTSEDMNQLYNATDATINVAHSEGFGLSTLCALMAGRPIIANLTGGLRSQLGAPTIYEPGGEGPARGQDHLLLADHGIGVWPNNRHIIDSPPAPFIWEEHSHADDVARAIVAMATVPSVEGAYEAMCKAAREYALKHFSLDELLAVFEDVFANNKVRAASQITIVDPFESETSLVDMAIR